MRIQPCKKVFAAILYTMLAMMVFSSGAVSRTEEIVAEGCAPIYDNMALSRDEAKRDALRTAVENVVGVRVRSDTRVENYQVAFHEVVMNSAGYVESAEIVPGTEAKYEADGLYCLDMRVEVLADLAVADMAGQLNSLCFIQKQFHRPRVMVSIDEKLFGDTVSMPISETEATRYLENLCINTVDKEQLKSIAGKEILKSLIFSGEGIDNIDDIDDMEIGPILSIIANAGAEWLLKGVATVDRESCSDEEVYGTSILSCQASVRVKMINTQSGQILAPVVAVENSGSPSGTKKSVAREALLSATQSAMDRAVEKIIENWKVGRGGEGACVETVVTMIGAGSKEFAAIKKHIEYLAGRDLCSIDTIKFSAGGNSKLSVNAGFTGQELFDYLMEDGVPGVDYEIVNYTQNSLDLKVSGSGGGDYRPQRRMR